MSNWIEKFKNVKYLGPEDPDKLKSITQSICFHLYEEIRGWSDKIEIELCLQRNASEAGVYLTLSIELPNASGITSSVLPMNIFRDPHRVRSACREVWGRLLDALIAQQMKQIDTSLAEMVEV